MKTKAEMINYLKNNYIPVESGKSFSIHKFQPEDAMGVIKCCYSIYGEGYPMDKYYIPEQLIEENSNGNIYGIVAKTKDNEVIGYGALYRSSSPNKKIYEAGQYIVQKEYRGTRAAYYINSELVKYAKELNIDCLYGETVTNHLITQKFAEKAGVITTAIELDLMPASAYSDDINVEGRVTTLIQILLFHYNSQTIYTPDQYRGIIAKSLEIINLTREISSTYLPKNEPDLSIIIKEEFDFAGVGRFHILEIGKDLKKTIIDFEETIIKKNYSVNQIYLNISDPNCIEIIEFLNSRGYFYGGYLPLWLNNDAILLQKLYAPPTYANINIFSEKDIELLNFIKEDYKRLEKTV